MSDEAEFTPLSVSFSNEATGEELVELDVVDETHEGETLTLAWDGHGRFTLSCGGTDDEVGAR
jgi:hypothetical protein